MAFDETALSAYVDENREPLIGKTVISAKSAKLFNLQTGVKGTSALNIVNNSVVFGDGSSCGWDAAGDTVLSQRNIATGQIKINKVYCDKDLIGTWAQHNVKIGVGTETLPFEQKITEMEIEGIGAVLETAIWQGDTDNISENLNKFDGLIKILSEDSDIVEVATSETEIDATNIISIIDAVYDEFPAEILDKDDLVIFCGSDTFRLAVKALRTANLYHYSYEIDGDMSFMFPGLNAKLIAVNGLNGTDVLVGGRLSNFYIGTDLENDKETFDFWYSKDNREHRLAVEFNTGVQVAFPDEVVIFETV